MAFFVLIMTQYTKTSLSLEMEGEDRQDYQPQAKYQPKSFSLSRTLTNFPQPQLLFQLINNISTFIRLHKCFPYGSKIISIRIS